MNRFTEVYYAEEQSRREFKQLVRHFDDLTDRQVRLKYKIKARFSAQVWSRRMQLTASVRPIAPETTSAGIG
jgi:hypothetical protein